MQPEIRAQWSRTSVEATKIERSWAAMKIGLHVADFTFPGGPATLAADLSRIARAAEDAGFARLSVI